MTNINEVTNVFELDDSERGFLGDFLEIGWRIIETIKVRSGDEFSFRDEVTWVLGASQKLGHPVRYTEWHKNRDQAYEKLNSLR